MKPTAFLLTVAILLAVCGWLSTVLPAGDAFGQLPPDRALQLDQLYSADVAGLKLRHARAAPTYDTMLFGNSRALPVGREDVAGLSGSFFNMAVAGESFRSSVMLLESLAAAGKLPRRAIISLDHAELQYYGNPDWPQPALRWPAAAQDLAAGLTKPSITPRDTARMAFRHLLTEGGAIQRDLNFARVRFGLCTFSLPSWACDDIRLQASDAPGYSADGSRRAVTPAQPSVDTGAALPAAPGSILAGYVDFDFERLQRIAAQGTQVMVYESLLFPTLHARMMQSPSATAQTSREAIGAACRRHGIICHMAPARFDDMNLPWADHNHPPAKLLGAYIGQLAAAQQAEAGS